MEDIRLEKPVEVICAQIRVSVPSDARKDRPALRRSEEVLGDIKEANNLEIALELGMLPHQGQRCPCRRKSSRGKHELKVERPLV